MSASPSKKCTGVEQFVTVNLRSAVQSGGGSCLVAPLTWVTRTDRALSMALRAPGEVNSLSLHQQSTSSALHRAACAPCLDSIPLTCPSAPRKDEGCCETATLVRNTAEAHSKA